MKKIFDIQLFADDPAADSAASGTDTKPTESNENQPERETKAERKYTEEDVDRIVKNRIAREREQAKKDREEAEKLAEMNATQKAEYERDKLQKELDEYKRKDALAEMSKVARKMLSDENIAIPDELLTMMVTTDAKETKTAIDGFAKLFKDSVETAVKERLRGETPRRGTGGDNPVSEIEKRIKKYS